MGILQISEHKYCVFKNAAFFVPHETFKNPGAEPECIYCSPTGDIDWQLERDGDGAVLSV